MLGAVDFDFCSAPFSEQDAVANFDFQRTTGAVLESLTVANCNNATFSGFFFCVVWKKNSTGCFLLSFYTLDEDTVIQRTD